MAELTPKELLQPSLLDRLTDRNPGSKTDTVEERVISLRRLKESVIRDLEWLLNTGCLEISRELGNYPEVRNSVLNYGVPDLLGTSADQKDYVPIERQIRQAILDFEPRLLAGTLKVRVAVNEATTGRNAVAFEIQGELWWQPLPERFYLKATLDPELGKVQTDLKE